MNKRSHTHIHEREKAAPEHFLWEEGKRPLRSCVGVFLSYRYLAPVSVRKEAVRREVAKTWARKVIPPELDEERLPTAKMEVSNA
jgi:hypothetical protein